MTMKIYGMKQNYINTILPQQTRKTLTTQPNFKPKTTGKRRTKEPPNQQKKRNHKDVSRDK